MYVWHTVGIPGAYHASATYTFGTSSTSEFTVFYNFLYYKQCYLILDFPVLAL